jgi:hypothetical protein
MKITLMSASVGSVMRSKNGGFSSGSDSVHHMFDSWFPLRTAYTNSARPLVKRDAIYVRKFEAIKKKKKEITSSPSRSIISSLNAVETIKDFAFLKCLQFYCLR